jgi:hypothetical protein
MSSRVPQSVESFGYHITPAAALPFPELGRDLGAALRVCYRGGRWFESTAAHHAG